MPVVKQSAKSVAVVPPSGSHERRSRSSWFRRPRLEASEDIPHIEIEPPHCETTHQDDPPVGPTIHMHPTDDPQRYLHNAWVPDGHSGSRGNMMDIDTILTRHPNLSDEVIKHMVSETAGVTKTEIRAATHLRNIRMKTGRLEKSNRTFWNSISGIAFCLIFAFAIAILGLLGYTKPILADGVTLLLVAAVGAMGLFFFFRMIGSQENGIDYEK